MDLTEKTKKREYIFDGKIIKVRRDEVTLPDGKDAFREVVEHRGGVCVLALTDDDRVLMVRQYRYPYGEVLPEIPAGKRDSLDEEPLECGKRELKEETGASAAKYTFLGEFYPSPGYTNEKIFIYLAEELSYGEDNPDDDEFLEVEKIPFDELLSMVLDGKIKDGKTQCAVMKTVLLKNKERSAKK